LEHGKKDFLNSNFEVFQFHPSVAAGVAAAGYVKPTPIQLQAISPVMQGRDVMGLAQTGTGKTAAFVLPILHRLMGKKSGRVRGLVVAPTRELAEQIHQDILCLGKKTGLRSASVYGGVSISGQTQKLRRGVDIVVACPGRLLDHLNRRNVDLSSLEVLVLDEADQMFDMGFFPDIRKILAQIPSQRQTLMFSATMPDPIRRLAADVLSNPVTAQVCNTTAPETVSHALYPVAQGLKTSLLLSLLGQTTIGSVLVFTRTKHRACRLGETLAKAGFRSTSLQGNLSQNKRQEALDGFRSGRFQILVATDIAARGIDVSNVSHVINFDVPATPEAYIHRIGRTGRAEHKGEAFTLITSEDRPMVSAIRRILGSPIEQRILPDFDYGRPEPVPAVRTVGGRISNRPGSSFKAGYRSAGQRSASSQWHRPAPARVRQRSVTA
jgi:ATP-dependent RNA helicase RhlE